MTVCVLPVPKRRVIPKPEPAGTARIAAEQIRRDTGFVEERSDLPSVTEG